MKEKDHPPKLSNTPAYSISDIMNLLGKNEPTVRKLIEKAGVEIDTGKSNPGETLCYEDFRRLWFSLANRRDGRLLGTLLVEESGNWWSNVMGKK
jgi:hypothetical protein